MKQTKLFVVVVFALAVLFATSAFAAQIDISDMKRSEVIDAIFDTVDDTLENGYGVKGTLKANISFIVAGVVTSVQDGNNYESGQTVEGTGQEATVWFSTNTDPADDSDFVSVDISELKRSEVIDVIFAHVSDDMLEGGYGVKGRLVTGKKITISGVLTGLQDGTEYTVGDTVNCNGQPATAWFSVNTDEDSSTPQITSIDISSMTRQQVLDAVAKKVISADIGNGGAVVELKEDIAFIVSGELTEVQDGENHTAGATVYGKGQTATLWFKVHTPESGSDNGGSNPGEGENGEGEENTEPKTYKAEELVSKGDLAKYFTILSEGNYGEVLVEVPALVTITIHEAWDGVSVQSNKTLEAGETYTTGNVKEKMTWWPNAEYWKKINGVQLTSANLNTFFSTTGDYGSWKVIVPNQAATGREISTPTSSDIIILTRKNGQVTEPNFVNSETEDEIIVAKKADIDNSNGQLFNSTDNLEKASPAPIKITVQSDGKVEVVFFAGVNKLHLVGTNIFKYCYDENRCTLEGNVLTTSDGYVIGTMTIYLNSRGNSNGGTNGGSEGGVSGSGGGGGGCNSMNYSALLFAVIPFALRKRS